MLVPGAIAVSQAVQAVAKELDMSIADINAIADGEVATAGTYGSGAKEKIQGVEVAAGDFSDFPAARAFGEQHSAAQQVFLETLSGVVTDLESFKRNLKKSAEDAEQQDQNAKQMLTSLGERSHGQSYESTQNFDDARNEHNEDLTYEGNDNEPGRPGEGGSPRGGLSGSPTPDGTDGHPAGPAGEQPAR